MYFSVVYFDCKVSFESLRVLAKHVSSVCGDCCLLSYLLLCDM